MAEEFERLFDKFSSPYFSLYVRSYNEKYKLIETGLTFKEAVDKIGFPIEDGVMYKVTFKIPGYAQEEQVFLKRTGSKWLSDEVKEFTGWV